MISLKLQSINAFQEPTPHHSYSFISHRIIIKPLHSCPHRYQQQTNNDGDDDVIIHRKSLMAIYMV